MSMIVRGVRGAGWVGLATVVLLGCVAAGRSPEWSAAAASASQVSSRGSLVILGDHGARYPPGANPYVQVGSKLSGGGESGQGGFGWGVALSDDGNTALIGGPWDSSVSAGAGVGAAWVFTRSGGVWRQQVPKLTGRGESGQGGFGFSVALSGDGNTALVGGPLDDNTRGAAWVFTRAGGVWRQQGSKLTGVGESGQGSFGFSVALSNDGNTALIGGSAGESASGLGAGAVWVFTRSDGVWRQQGPKLAGRGENGQGDFGYGVALSADGNTALVGGPDDNGDPASGLGVGAAWVFIRTGGVWRQQGPKLTGRGESYQGSFGQSVALSGDGNTALIGGPSDGGLGAAWVFTRSRGVWRQHGPKLTGTGEKGPGFLGYSVGGHGFFGYSVALARDGNTALIGGPNETRSVGAAWVFTRLGGEWRQQGTKPLTGAGESGPGYFGDSVAVSADGTTTLIGGDDNEISVSSGRGVGAAWATGSGRH